MAELTGAQQKPPVASSATGSASVALSRLHLTAIVSLVLRGVVRQTGAALHDGGTCSAA